MADAEGSRRGQIVLVLVAAPAYWQRPLALLAERLGARFRLLTGDSSWEPGVTTGVADGPHVSRVRNRFLAGNRLVWQRGAVRPAVRADVAILDLNPRVLNTWLVLLVRRALRRPTVLRGHVWSRRGRQSRTEPVRNAQRRLADVLVTYTETEAREIRAKNADARVVAAPNALYGRDELGAASGTRPPSDLIYVGRLVAVKKPRILVEAFLAARDELPRETRLILVGDGPERGSLESLARASNGEDRIRFVGHLADPDELRELYAEAIASVSPGYVGLSLIQSVGFGVPMVISRDEPHAPEIEAAIEGVTCVMFETDSVDDLRRVLVTVTRERDHWAERRTELAELCAERYAAESMVDRLVEAVELAQAVRP
jgi:glycosyltransferase involved in cell wall biosynthesis